MVLVGYNTYFCPMLLLCLCIVYDNKQMMILTLYKHYPFRAEKKRNIHMYITYTKNK